MGRRGRESRPVPGRGTVLTPSPAATRHLGRVQPRFRELHRRHGAPPWQRTRNSFRSLARAIIYQQLAGAAAAAMYSRFRGLFPGGRCPTPTQVQQTSLERLRSAGLSRQKASYLLNLAQHYRDGSIRPRDFPTMSDETVRRVITSVKGLGPWTADIFLMFDLLRPDILPVGDYGLQQGFRLLFELDELPLAAAMIDLAEPWRPYRSQACWYLWRLLEDNRG